MQTRQRAAPPLLGDGRGRGHRNRARLRSGRTRGGVQLAQPSHGAGCSAAGAGDQSRSPQAGARPAARPRVEGANRDQSELFHRRPGDGARAAQAVRHHQGDCEHHASHLGRGISGRPLHGHPGQRDSVHRRGRRKDGDGNAGDPGRFRGRPHRSAGRQSERALQPRRGGGWPHRNRVRGILLEAGGGRPAPCSGKLPRPAAGAPSAQRAAASRHLFDGGQPPATAQGRGARARHGRLRGAPARLPRAGLQIRRAQPQHHPRRGRGGGTECRADAFGRDARLMIVMKFGGTSVESAAAITRVAGIVRARQARRPVVVVSAMGKTTNKLLEIAGAAIGGKRAEYIRLLHDLRDYHSREARLTDRKSTRADLDRFLDEHFQELTELVKGLAVLGELTPRSIDAISSYGERLSSYIVTLAFRHFGMPAEHVDSRDVLITDKRHTHAAPNFPETYARLKKTILPLAAESVVVMGGFIASTEDGVTTTLGRGGSDYTAAIVGAGLDAEEIEIWTDVDGMLTADPTILPGGHRVKTISFAEAAELAYFGAKVLHPATVVPAIEKNIPVMILNSRRPEVDGTRIVAETVPCGNTVKSIACKRKIKLVNIHSTRMLMAHGFLRRIFEAFDRYETAVDMVSTSEVSVSLTIDNTKNLDAILTELRQFSEAEPEHGQAIVCLVGENIRYTPGVARRVFDALDGIHGRMISQGASLLNLSVVVSEASLPRAVASLHDAFFAELDPAVFERNEAVHA